MMSKSPNPNTRLSRHFTLSEAAASRICAEKGWDNAPPRLARMPTGFLINVHEALSHVAETVLEPIRAAYGAPYSPSSWYRCKALNDHLGSSPRSQHRFGQAVDVVLPDWDTHDLAGWVAENVDFDQLIVEGTSSGRRGWVHISAVKKSQRFANRGEILLQAPDGGFRRISPSELKQEAA